MIHRDVAYCAPFKIGSLKTIDQTHDIVCAACSLPVEKFLWGHVVILSTLGHKFGDVFYAAIFF
jgi:hypothetical protein